MGLRPFGNSRSSSSSQPTNTVQVQIVTLYPGGTAQAPGSVLTNTRTVVTNPFPGEPVMSRLEVLKDGVWGDPGFTFNSGAYAGYGVKVTQVANSSSYGDLVVQSGSAAVLAPPGYTGSPHQGGIGSESSLPFRIIVWKIKA